jgi:hypothetical protein
MIPKKFTDVMSGLIITELMIACTITSPDNSREIANI